MSSLTQGGSKTIVVTGGCGFIGSAVVRKLIRDTDFRVINVDKLTYAADRSSVADAARSARYHFVHGDIADKEMMREVFSTYRPDALMNLAAETHVDRSIDGPEAFFRSNVAGTYALLEAARAYVRRSPNFRFHQVSTDEVFGSLGPEDPGFTELTRYDPSSPYSASKACADHLVRAWGKTFGMDVVLTNCSNNYGPFQFPEKLIPVMILNALAGKALPLYGNGRQVREWLYVDDHADALVTVLLRGASGESYNVGSGEERHNIDVVRSICAILDSRGRRHRAGELSKLVQYVTDRPAHDRRYAIDSSKIKNELDWKALETFETGLEKTVDWYLERHDRGMHLTTFKPQLRPGLQ